jgi:tRNA threonylcarbamoyladenosine biosynthesis protein TsaB
VAISLAKGMALAHGLPLVGVSTLDATAYPHLGGPDPVCAVVQAGRGRICWATYLPGAPADSADVAALGAWRSQRTPITLTGGEELAAALDRRVRLVGELTPELRDLLAARAGALAVLPGPAVAVRRAGYVAELGWQRWQAGQTDNPASLSPIYLHEP